MRLPGHGHWGSPDLQEETGGGRGGKKRGIGW